MILGATLSLAQVARVGRASLPVMLGTLAAALLTALATLALAAVGLSTRMGDVRRAGFRPLLFGALVWIAVAGTSLALQRLTGPW